MKVCGMFELVFNPIKKEDFPKSSSAEIPCIIVFLTFISRCLWNGDDKIQPCDNFMKDLAIQRFGTGEDIYLNAGLIAGRARDLLRVFEMVDFQVFEDDQAVLTDFMYRRPNELILDYNQAIFGNNRHSTNGCMFQRERSDKRLIHSETETAPFFIHSPGGYIFCHEKLASRLGVELGSVDERRKLQDWKRKMQNYQPVCNYVCPPNSAVRPNTRCLDTFSDCRCNNGFRVNPSLQVCTRNDVPPDCTTYRCPPNSVVKRNVQCLDTFNDCQCNSGFIPNSNSQTCTSCTTYSCPANSVVKRNIQCLDTFDDCQCNPGFTPNSYLKTCTSCNTYTCPRNSSRKSNVQCLKTFNDCQCNRGFRRNSATRQCIR